MTGQALYQRGGVPRLLHAHSFGVYSRGLCYSKRYDEIIDLLVLNQIAFETLEKDTLLQ